MMKPIGIELKYTSPSARFTAYSVPLTAVPATETTTGPARSKQRI